MTDSTWTAAPKKILLATDLSSRCDRALDRAAQLAKQWSARLLILHVLEPAANFLLDRELEDLPSWRRPPDRARAAQGRIRADLMEDIADFSVRVEDGDPAAVIDRVANEEGCDLIVTGVARDETFGRVFLGATVNRLIRKTPIPILITKSRVRPYREIVIATDFSESSRHALKAAAAFFPAAALTLFHAFEVPFASLLDKSAAGQFSAMEQEAASKFLAGSDLSSARRAETKILIEHGVPEIMIRAYMQDRGVHLVALGTHGRSALFDVLIGSTAKRILEYAPGDVLLVREPKSLPAR